MRREFTQSKRRADQAAPEGEQDAYGAKCEVTNQKGGFSVYAAKG